jgi:hypothetical protein
MAERGEIKNRARYEAEETKMRVEADLKIFKDEQAEI